MTKFQPCDLAERHVSHHVPPAKARSAASHAHHTASFKQSAKRGHVRSLNLHFAEFKRGCVNLSNEFRDGRPSTAVNNKNIDAVRRMIETDRHVTYREIQA
ncbi:hypothetical protein EVAR_3204_1 [Eumeta japonica]|uniref:Uncharacterized protein n=1 Tax=Eumeta variegata TaxID=151549 RepID=A0A4C1SUT4_EUMVA|nr:hypothetical protein EVAR_3204_1 [Eumeta japonica]